MLALQHRATLPVRFVDLFAGLGGFHVALTELGGECVYASEIDPELRELYSGNHGVTPDRVGGDIRVAWDSVPEHDVLCAGFPCQPFSKSGAQLGTRDPTRGTLFDFVLKIAGARRPSLILLENVGNFERHDSGRTWSVVRESIRTLGYDVYGTEHIRIGGSGLLSPHHLGLPQVRERFFAVAARQGFLSNPLDHVRGGPNQVMSLGDVVQSTPLSPADAEETRLSDRQIACIEHWNEFIKRMPSAFDLPSFPIWSDEFEATYPVDRYVTELSTADLRRFLPGSEYSGMSRDELLECYPRYMRNGTGPLPVWKTTFLKQNRSFFAAVQSRLRKGWLEELRAFPPSLRKLEWNCRGEDRELWKCVLQFRPSGLRAKRYTSIPALVAMTTTQIPILGPKRRFITRSEALRLQGMPPGLRLPASRTRAFQALGNGVHAVVARKVYSEAVRHMTYPALKKASTG